MFKPSRTMSWLAVASVSFILLFPACESKKTPPSQPQEFAEFISAYTSGLISKEAQIRLVLVKPIADFPGANEPVQEGVVRIDPNIEGQWTWEDQNTLLFTPAQHLPSGEQYQVHLELGKLVDDVADDLSRFTFNFGVIAQQFEVSQMNLRTYQSSQLEFNKIEGDILSTDVADLAELEALLQVQQNKVAKRISWRSDASRMRHHFVIDSVSRTAQKGVVNFEWSSLVGDTYKPEQIEIPALGDFKILGVNVVQSPEQKVIVNFSDPLMPEQNLSGLVQIENAQQPGFRIEDTELHLLVKGTISGERLVTIFPGIKNVAGYAIKENYETPVKFADLKPAVELIGKGTVLPSSSDLSLPFKAVNLKAVDVFVLKIFSSNVPQFLQTNRMEGNYQLKRVGRPVAYKKIDLGESRADLKSWNTYSLDLSELMKPEPGAIYRIEFKFKGSYSLYACPDSEKKEDLLTIADNDELNTEDYDSPNSYYWDNYYDDYYWGDYNYRERDNPCNAAYYTSRRTVARNIMATDLALTVKGGDKGGFVAFVTDLKTAKPVPGAKVRILNYQQQTMKEGTTASDGAVRFQLDGKPFLVVAHHQGQDAYMRIDDGSALSMSNFDVAGSYVKKGLKGFIYGERGVWRPGDSIFTHFILEDAENALPDDHPVIFEVRNPEGKLIERQVKSTHLSGIYAFPFATEQDAITGFYSCQVRVGGTSFHKSLRVETIKPNRLKVNLTFNDKILEGSAVSGLLHANWLTGAKAKNLKADINMQIRHNNQPFEAYKAYDFTDETRRFHTTEKEVFKGVLDANGDAQTNLKIGSYSRAPGMLKAVFVSRVFEQGGEFSIDRQSFQYAPFNHFVGLKTERPANAPWLTTDKPVAVNLVTTNAQGQPTDRKVTAQVYAIDWSWWWSSGRNGMANYLNSSYARSISQQELETVNGRGSISFQVNYPNYGNYLIRVCDDQSGHCTSQVVYIDWPMSRDRGGRSNPGAPTMLSFSADKDQYNVGDVAHLTIPTSKSGRLLVSVETGSELIEHMWVDAEEGQTEIDIPVTEAMSPNVYAFVSYIQPHAKTENDLPIRLYGVIPINVHDADSKLEPVIASAVEWQPEKKAAIRVKEKSGKPMAYTIAVVDEGLLDITRFKTPNPWHHFYAKEALGIRTWDFFDDVIGAFGGVIQKNFAIGGDEELDPAGKKRMNRFKPLVKVFGPFYLKAGEEATTEFRMPNYIGSAKVMVVARKGKAYGHADKTIPVRKPLMVLATLPRVLGPGETVRLPVQVFAMKDHVKNVSIKVKAGSLFEVEQPSQNLHFDEVGDQMAYFDLTVKHDIGTGTVDITVQSGAEKATYNVAVDVRNPNRAETKTQSVVLKPGESHAFLAEKFGLPRSNKQTLQISSIPELNMADALGYLLRYPHGCIEQTVSAVFPQLFVDELMQMSEAQKALSKENILHAIKKLQANQMGNGAFSTWPSSSYVNGWSTIYAGHFMLEAELKGYTIPASVKSRWLAYEKRAAANWRHNANKRWYELEQSYRLFVLAKAGEPDVGAMNRLRHGSLTKSAAWRLAAAYAIIGQKDAANALINKAHPATTYNYYDPTFGNEMRASAMRLETFLLLNHEVKAFEQAIVLAKQLNNKSLYTTQSTSFALLAMSQFLAGKSNNVLQAKWEAGEEGEQLKQANPFYASPLKVFHETVSVLNQGSENLYVSLVQEGIPLPGQESGAAQGLSVHTEFQTLQGEVIDPNRIVQGEDFKAVVRISSDADRYKLHDMALSQIFPSGWEIVNTRLLDLEDVSGQSSFTYRDYRDDRVLTYFDMDNRHTKMYEVRLNASYLGRYYLPGAQVEAMYFPDVLSAAKGTWVNVVKPQ